MKFPVQFSFHGHVEQPWPLSVGSLSLLVPAWEHQPIVPFACFCWLLVASELIIPHLPAPPDAPYPRQRRRTPSTATTPHPINGDAAPPRRRRSLMTALPPSTTPLLTKTTLTYNTDNHPPLDEMLAAPSRRDARRSLTTRRSPLPLDETLAAPSRRDARRSLPTRRSPLPHDDAAPTIPSDDVPPRRP